MSEESEQAVDVTQERRQNLRLRSVYDAAFLMIEPFLDPEHGWAGQSLEHLAYRIVRENFPELTADEVHALVVVAHRVYGERHPPVDARSGERVRGPR